MCIKPIDIMFLNVSMPMITGATFAEQVNSHIRNANEAQSYIQIMEPTFVFVCTNPKTKTFNYMTDAIGVENVLHFPLEAKKVEELLMTARRDANRVRGRSHDGHDE